MAGDPNDARDCGRSGPDAPDPCLQNKHWSDHTRPTGPLAERRVGRVAFPAAPNDRAIAPWRAIRTMLATVAVAGQMRRTLAFKINTGQIIQDQPDRLRKGALVELLFQRHPT